ncbi:MAG: serine/threonine-protein kinase [Byssovorax sp.]
MPVLSPIPPLAAGPAGEPPPPADSLAGTPYRVIAPIDRGGMGEVIEAEHIGLAKRVVVKLLHPELADDPRLVQRMQSEARTLARLANPHIVTVSDFGRTPEGRTYLVMELLHGRTLRQEIEARGALPVREAIRWVRQVLIALGAAHRHGVIHRDVKLDNIFLCEPSESGPERAVLLDFGIAKILRAPAGASTETPHQPTEQGTIVGTPRFVSPEQAKGQPVDGRTDLYALGLVLYTLVAGRGPFAHLRDPMDLLAAHVGEPPLPPSHFGGAHISPALDRLVLKALAKRPEHRFQTAAEFAEALFRVEQEAGVTQPLQLEATPHPAEAAPGGTWILPRASSRPEPPAPPEESTAPTVPLARVAGPAPRLGVGPFVALLLGSTAFFLVLLSLVIHYLRRG